MQHRLWTIPMVHSLWNSIKPWNHWQRFEIKTYVACDQFDIAAAVGIVFVWMRAALNQTHYLDQASGENATQIIKWTRPAKLKAVNLTPEKIKNSNGLSRKVCRTHSSERYYWIWILKYQSGSRLRIQRHPNFWSWIRPSRTSTWTRNHPMLGTDCYPKLKWSEVVAQISECEDVVRFNSQRISANYTKISFSIPWTCFEKTFFSLVWFLYNPNSKVIKWFEMKN